MTARQVLDSLAERPCRMPRPAGPRIAGEHVVQAGEYEAWSAHIGGHEGGWVWVVYWNCEHRAKAILPVEYGPRGEYLFAGSEAAARTQSQAAAAEWNRRTLKTGKVYLQAPDAGAWTDVRPVGVARGVAEDRAGPLVDADRNRDLDRRAFERQGREPRHRV